MPSSTSTSAALTDDPRFSSERTCCWACVSVFRDMLSKKRASSQRELTTRCSECDSPQKMCLAGAPSVNAVATGPPDC